MARAIARHNPCPECGARPGTECSTVNGTRRDDHAVRVRGIGPALPSFTDGHHQHPACRCRSCTERAARARARTVRESERAARETAEQAAQDQRAAAAAARAARAARPPVQRHSTEGQRAAPCYCCDAPIGLPCLTNTGQPRRAHAARGVWGAWRLPSGAEGRITLPRPPLVRLVAAAQPDLLPRVTSERRRKAAA